MVFHWTPPHKWVGVQYLVPCLALVPLAMAPLYLGSGPLLPPGLCSWPSTTIVWFVFPCASYAMFAPVSLRLRDTTQSSYARSREVFGVHLPV